MHVLDVYVSKIEKNICVIYIIYINHLYIDRSIVHAYIDPE